MGAELHENSARIISNRTKKNKSGMHTSGFQEGGVELLLFLFEGVIVCFESSHECTTVVHPV